MEKQCSICHRVLSSEAFYGNRTHADGLTSECRNCVAARYQQNRVEILAKKKAAYKPQPHRPSILAANGIKRCTRCKESKEATTNFWNLSKSSADGFYNECRACRTQLRRQRKDLSAGRWKRSNEGALSDQKKWRIKIRQEMLDAYGRKCACCGEIHEQFLTLDHIGGKTEENHPWHHRRAGTSIYGKLKKRGWPKDFRLLCMNCNWVIRHGEPCPHSLSGKLRTLISLGAALSLSPSCPPLLGPSK